MWWHDNRLMLHIRRVVHKRLVLRRALSIAFVFAIGGLTAGCFQPLYAEKSLNGEPSIKNALNSVDIAQIEAPNGSPLSRIAVAVRNDLVFNTTGGGAQPPPQYRLRIRLSSTQISVIVNIQSNRPDVQNYGLNATYDLVDLKTNKVVVQDQAFSRVSYDLPGEEQRFAGARALRDAENRASQILADSIKARLASYFVAGT
jgi:LPS-assembly lipoprotein